MTVLVKINVKIIVILTKTNLYVKILSLTTESCLIMITRITTSDDEIVTVEILRE